MMTALIVLTVAASVTNLYLINWRGIVIRPLIAAVYAGYCVIEGWLALRDPAQAAIGLFMLVNLWGLGTAIAGWIRAS